MIHTVRVPKFLKKLSTDGTRARPRGNTPLLGRLHRGSAFSPRASSPEPTILPAPSARLPRLHYSLDYGTSALERRLTDLSEEDSVQSRRFLNRVERRFQDQQKSLKRQRLSQYRQIQRNREADYARLQRNRKEEIASFAAFDQSVLQEEERNRRAMNDPHRPSNGPIVSRPSRISLGSNWTDDDLSYIRHVARLRLRSQCSECSKKFLIDWDLSENSFVCILSFIPPVLLCRVISFVSRGFYFLSTHRDVWLEHCRMAFHAIDPMLVERERGRAYYWKRMYYRLRREKRTNGLEMELEGEGEEIDGNGPRTPLGKTTAMFLTEVLW